MTRAGSCWRTWRTACPFDQWIYAFCQRENVRTRNEFKFSIVERNFANFVDWLTDEGKVEVRREFCAKHYFHREK